MAGAIKSAVKKHPSLVRHAERVEWLPPTVIVWDCYLMLAMACMVENEQRTVAKEWAGMDVCGQCTTAHNREESNNTSGNLHCALPTSAGSNPS